MLTDAPARHGAADRSRPDRSRAASRPGARASIGDLPFVRQVWRAGERVRLIGAPRPEARLALYWAPRFRRPAARSWAPPGWAAMPRAARRCRSPGVPGLDIAELTADPRGYGLHATLEAALPARPVLGGGGGARPRRWRRGWRPSTCRRWRCRTCDGFLALRESAPCPGLQALADACVEALDPCRAPARGGRAGAATPIGPDPRQEALLARSGYPYVFEEWRFHVTLTRRLTPAEKAVVLPAVTDFLGDGAGPARRVTAMASSPRPRPGRPS